MMKEHVKKLVERGSITPDEVKELRCNSEEWLAVMRRMNDDAFIAFMEHALKNCARYSLPVTYDENTIQNYAPELLRRFRDAWRARNTPLVICLLLRIGFVSRKRDGAIVWPLRLHLPLSDWPAMWRTGFDFGLFRNKAGVVKWIPGRLLPRRWGFMLAGFEFGDRGSHDFDPQQAQYDSRGIRDARRVRERMPAKQRLALEALEDFGDQS